MSTYRPGDKVPYASRPENQSVEVTRKTWGELMKRVAALEKGLDELTESMDGSND